MVSDGAAREGRPCGSFPEPSAAQPGPPPWSAAPKPPSQTPGFAPTSGHRVLVSVSEAARVSTEGV